MSKLTIAAIAVQKWRHLLGVTLFLLTSMLLYAQQRTITGRVLDEDKKPVAGASVIIKGTQIGATTNENGTYTIAASDNQTLVISAVGFDVIEARVGTQSTINVNLKNNSTELEGVVVTALGITRKEKALGYSVGKVAGEELTDAKSTNWTNALSGRVAGLNMLKTGGGPAGSNRIILRGEGSLTGTDEALIVIDGVVMGGSNRHTGTGSGAYLSNDSPTDFGTSLNDINPEDIESVTILKGPGASALYGARGAGGAIIITTKSGKPKAKGLGVTFTSNAEVEMTSRWPEFQYEYGQGLAGENYYSYLATVDGASTRSTSSAWGPRFDGQSYFQYDPETRTTGKERTPWVPYKNNRKGFFQTGHTFTNSVAIDGGTAKTNARLSFTNLQNKWIIPNTGYDRNTVALSVNNQLTDKLKVSTRVNYTNKKSDNLPSTGYNNQTIMYFIIAQAPNVDLNWYKQYWQPGKEGIEQTGPFSSLIDNPYLIVNEMLNKQNRHTMVGNVQANYSFTKNLNLMVRTALDYAFEERSQQRPKSTEKYKEGMFRTQNIFTMEQNSDFLLRYTPKINNKFTADVSFGGSTMRNRYSKDELRAERLNYPGVFNFSNSKDLVQTYPYRSEFGVNSLYGLASLSYNNIIFLDATGRKDWSSTLATPGIKRDLGFFYPSVNLSTILSDAFKLPGFISFAKLRASWSDVGNAGTKPYLTSYTYNPESSFPSGLSNPTSIANPFLVYENSITWELGTDLRFFKNRLALDVAVYRSNRANQILPALIDRSSGFSSVVVNSGMVQNKGLEIELKGNPIKKKKGLNWNVTGTFSTNRNIVVSLADSLETLVLQTGPGGRGSIEARPGGTMGAIYGLGYLRSPDGQIVYQNGYPLLDQNQKLLGKTTPDWKASIGNEFRYKQFRFNFLVDGQFGAKAYSLTHANSAIAGKLKKTLPGRYNGIIGNGVILEADGKYRQNDVVAESIWTYYDAHFNRDNVEANLFSTDFIKLREARFDYTLPSKVTKKLKLQKGTIGIYGRDLLIISNWPAYDPEFGTLNNGSIQAGFELGQFPATRTMGVNLTLSL